MLKKIKVIITNYSLILEKNYLKSIPMNYQTPYFFEVYTRINYIENRCGVTRQTAATYLSQVLEVGLLDYEKIGRESIYKSTRLIDLFKSLYSQYIVITSI